MGISVESTVSLLSTVSSSNWNLEMLVFLISYLTMPMTLPLISWLPVILYLLWLGLQPWLAGVQTACVNAEAGCPAFLPV